MNSLETRVQEIIAEQLNIPASQVTTTATLQTLGADSLDIVELIMRFEDEFEIEIADEDAENLATVADVVTYIAKLKAQ